MRGGTGIDLPAHTQLRTITILDTVSTAAGLGCLSVLVAHHDVEEVPGQVMRLLLMSGGVVVPVLVVVVVEYWCVVSLSARAPAYTEAVRLPLSDCTSPGLSSSFRLPGPAHLPPPSLLLHKCLAWLHHHGQGWKISIIVSQPCPALPSSGQP